MHQETTVKAVDRLPDTSSIDPESLTPYDISLNLPLIAGVIKEARVSRNFTPKELFEITGVRANILSAIENSAKRPARTVIINLSKVLDIAEVNQLLILAGHQPLLSDEVQQ